MIQLNIKNIAQIRQFLNDLPPGVKNVGNEAATKYVVGDMSHGLKHYVPYKYISVKQAGGWRSDRQRRYVMMMIKRGEIDPGYPHRTGAMQRAWDYKREGGSNFRISNPLDYVKYVMGDTEQSRGHKLRGWRKVSAVVKNNIDGAIRSANAAVNKWLREHS